MIAHEVHVFALVRVLLAALEQHVLKEMSRPCVRFRIQGSSDADIQTCCSLFALRVVN